MALQTIEHGTDGMSPLMLLAVTLLFNISNVSAWITAIFGLLSIAYTCYKWYWDWKDRKDGKK